MLAADAWVGSPSPFWRGAFKKWGCCRAEIIGGRGRDRNQNNCRRDSEHRASAIPSRLPAALLTSMGSIVVLAERRIFKTLDPLLGLDHAEVARAPVP